MKTYYLHWVLVPILICTIHKYFWNIYVPGIVLGRVTMTDKIPALMQFLSWGRGVDMQTDKWIYKCSLWWVLEEKNGRLLVEKITGAFVVNQSIVKSHCEGLILIHLSKLWMRISLKDIQIWGLDSTSPHFLRDFGPLTPFLLPNALFFSTDPNLLSLSSLSYFENITFEFFSPVLLTSFPHHWKPPVVPSSYLLIFCSTEVCLNDFLRHKSIKKTYAHVLIV